MKRSTFTAEMKTVWVSEAHFLVQDDGFLKNSFNLKQGATLRTVKGVAALSDPRLSAQHHTVPL